MSTSQFRMVQALTVGGFAFWVIQATAQTANLPIRTDDNLIVAAYNIQWLGDRTHDYQKLAQIIQHFDVCGIVEVKKEKAVRELAEALELATQKKWGYAFGVRTHRPGGSYHEAYGVLWRKDRVELGNGVIGGIWDLEEAFRNDPYIVSFKRKNFDFTLFLIHTRWTDDVEGSRAGEVAMIAEQLLWMRGIMEERDWIVAGDFNYDGTHSAIQGMMSEADLIQLDSNEKSTFKSNNQGYANSYEHMFVFDGETTEYLAGTCHTLDTTKIIYGNNSKASMAASKKELSDHLPIFAIFNVSGPDDD